MDGECQRKWYWFIAVDVAVYFGGLLLIFLWKWFKRLLCRRKTMHSRSSQNLENHYQSRSNVGKDEIDCLVTLRYYANQFISTQYFTGKMMALVSSIATLLSTILYLYEIFQEPLMLERCKPLGNVIFLIDVGCNIVFLVYFVLRFSTSNEKIKFWLGFYTIIDIFTISQICTALVLNQEWIGLRFLRVLALMRVQEVLQCFNLIRSGTSIRVIQLISIFICILLVGAGFVHLLENSGEITFVSNYTNNFELSYGDSLYFIIVTLSTVGYGDIAARTVSGKIFVAIFILLALAAFASFIPELSEFLFARSQYLGCYNKESGRKHVIVCGHINYASASTFLMDFLHEDRSTPDVEVVFINKKEPDIEMKNLLKIYFTQVKYFQGTVMDQNDLERVQMSTADACLILANQNCSEPNDEDAGNIMRAISFKNYCYRCPVIIQLIQFENKTYLQNIPTWNKRNGDQIICYSEIELGILAQSCLVPGFSTFLTNLFSVRSEKECKPSNLNDSWLNDYMRGVTMEIYSAKLSKSFEDYSYRELVEFCFKNLNLLLIAVEIYDSVNKKKILLINPLNCNKIATGSVGFFICDSYKDAINAHLFCSKCHEGLRDLTLLKQCGCRYLRDDYKLTVISRLKSEEEISLTKCDAEIDFNEIQFLEDNSITKKGKFYACAPQKILKCVISSEHQTEYLNGHVILCIFSDKKSSVIGLRNFLMPLRSTTVPENELKDLLIITEKDFIEKEWSEICCFPKIRVVFHQISIRRIVNLIAIDKCSRCVILNGKTNFADLQNDAYMVDKEIIITNLYFQAESRRRVLKKNSRRDSAKTKEMELTDNFQSVIQNDASLEFESPLCRVNGDYVPIISKLAVESNVQYLDVKEDNIINIPNYLRKPFAFGCAFTTSMLDSMLSTAYYNQNAISIMEMLINGGSLEELEGDNDEPENSIEKVTNQFRINVIPVSQFKQTINWSNSVFYRDLFIESLQMNNSVCLGLYRKRVLSAKTTASDNTDRYVITNPAANFPIDETDIVYCLQQKCPRSKKNEISAVFNVDRI